MILALLKMMASFHSMCDIKEYLIFTFNTTTLVKNEHNFLWRKDTEEILINNQHPINAPPQTQTLHCTNILEVST